MPVRPVSLRWPLFAGLSVMMLATDAGANPSCTFSITNIDFGVVDPSGVSPIDITGTLTATCQDSNEDVWVTICPSLGSGTGGVHSSGDPRYLVSGANQLRFNLYKNASRTQIWGSMFWGPSPEPSTWRVHIEEDEATANRTIYGRIPGGQVTPPAGTYASVFSGVNARMEYKQGEETCASIHQSADDTVDKSFTVSATVQSSCSVGSTDLDFGSVGLLDANVDAANQVQVNCGNGVPYTVSLDGGLSGASDPTQRLMSFGGSDVTYALYRDGSRTLPWGDTIGVNTLSDTGSGSVQNHTVYGRVAPQTTPAPATYTDTIVVTVTY